MSAHPAGRRAAVKAGCNPVHFSLDGRPLSCYFSGSVATTSGHFVHKSERRTRDGGFHIRPVLLMNPDLRLRLHATQAQPCFLAASNRAASNAVALPGGNGIFNGNADRAYNTLHFAPQSRVPNGGVAPFGNPHKKKAICYPPRGAYRLFLLSSPPAVSVEQKSAWD